MGRAELEGARRGELGDEHRACARVERHEKRRANAVRVREGQGAEDSIVFGELQSLLDERLTVRSERVVGDAHRFRGAGRSRGVEEHGQ